MSEVIRRSFRSRIASALVAGACLACSSAALAQPHAATINLTQSHRMQAVLPGMETMVSAYTGVVAGGPPGTLTPVPNSYLGPTIHARAGQRVNINLFNQIGEPSITHWHGMDVPANMDGHPAFAIPHGAMYAYSFPVLNRAGTYWYHPHTDMMTASQVQMGLAGFLLVHDAEEAALDLPTGAYDVPLCIQDRTFDADNQLVYNPDMMTGFFGATICVNGQPNYVHPTASRVHRLRLLNGSSSRIYKLAFADGTPMVVIGSDGGLLSKPEHRPYVTLAPGERAEVWADFRGRPAGTQVALRSLPFTGAGADQGAAFEVMRFRIDQAVAEHRTLPARLSTIVPYRLRDAVNARHPKTYAIAEEMRPEGMVFTLNGGTFSMLDAAPNEVARCDTLEVIRVSNTDGMMGLAHPIHFHGRQFQIVGREVMPEARAAWHTVKDGFLDSGWKDTFLVMPGETVTILVRHGSYPGLFNYHCHNLEHEDMGMMRNLRLVR